MLLTGTPLQNCVDELFSLLNFLEPTTFPSHVAFLHKFGDLKTEEQVEELKTVRTHARARVLCVCMCMCACVHVRICVFVFVYVYVCCVYVLVACMCVCVCVCPNIRSITL